MLHHPAAPDIDWKIRLLLFPPKVCGHVFGGDDIYPSSSSAFSKASLSSAVFIAGFPLISMPIGHSLLVREPKVGARYFGGYFFFSSREVVWKTNGFLLSVVKWAKYASRHCAFWPKLLLDCCFIAALGASNDGWTLRNIFLRIFLWKPARLPHDLFLPFRNEWQ